MTARKTETLEKEQTIRVFAKIAFMTSILKYVEDQHLRKRADLIVLQYKQFLDVSYRVYITE